MDRNNSGPHLVADIGNSRIKFALFDQREMIEYRAFSFEETKSMNQWIGDIGASLVICITVANSKEWLREHLSVEVEILLLDRFNPLPFESRYRSPETLGVDRIAAIVAALKKYNQHTHLLVITAGTCITYNWILDGVFFGGSISPGLHMRLQSMHDYTRKLPLAEPSFQTELIPSTTLEALGTGAFKGIVFEIEGYMAAFQLQWNKPVRCIITGGDATVLAQAMENTIFADAYLILEGINEIYLRRN